MKNMVIITMIMMSLVILVLMIMMRMAMNCKTYHWSEGVKYGQPPKASVTISCHFNSDKSFQMLTTSSLLSIETLATELACE